MEIRVLRYFLAVAREESISNAAEYLHITQPTLSRQIMELEKQLGRKLLNRGKRNHKITLTNEGILLRNRAEEIITLVDKTKAEFTIHDEVISGNVYPFQRKNRINIIFMPVIIPPRSYLTIIIINIPVI